MPSSKDPTAWAVALAWLAQLWLHHSGNPLWAKPARAPTRGGSVRGGMVGLPASTRRAIWLNALPVPKSPRRDEDELTHPPSAATATVGSRLASAG
jgi:hypothetical protein